MPKKVYIIENLDCANCAAKIEAKFNAHPEVEEATITFATRQLRLTAADPDALIPELTKIARTVEGEVTIKPRDREAGHAAHHHGEGHECGCGHHHGEDHECGCGHHHGEDHECACGHHHEESRGHSHSHSHNHGESILPLLIGGGLFAVGLVLGHLGFNWLTLAICLAAYIVLGREVVATAAKNLVKGHVFDENFLMSIATIGAFFIGEYPEAVGVMLFYRVGEYFEHKAVERSRSQIMEAVDLRPETVNLVLDEGVQVIPAEKAAPGDLVLVRPGDRIPLDGVVTAGESRIDTAPITGEPVPVAVKPPAA